MKENKRLLTNIKAFEKEVFGNFEEFKQSAMIWSFRENPLFIDFDLPDCENYLTEQLLQHWNSPNKIIESPIPTLKKFHRPRTLSSQMKIECNDTQSQHPIQIEAKSNLEKLYNRAEEITKQISEIVGGKFEDPILFTKVESLKSERRIIWEKIENEEMLLNTTQNIIPQIDSKQHEKPIIQDNNEMKKTSIQNANQKIGGQSNRNQINEINQQFDNEIEYVNKSDEQTNESNQNYEENVKPNQFHEQNEQTNHFEEQSDENDLSDGQSYQFDDKNQLNDIDIEKAIQNIISNHFDQFTLKSIENQLIHAILKNNKSNFAVIENNLKDIRTDLVYLIPGLIEPKLTLIVMNDPEIDQRIEQFSHSLKMEKLINDVTIYPRLFKNEINFLYVTPDVFNDNQKLYGIIKLINSRNLLHRIVFYSNDDLSLIDKFNEIPILIIQSNSFHLSNFKIFKEKLKIRENVFLSVSKKISPLLTKNMNDIAKWIIDNHLTEQNGIIICLTNRDCESINSWLNKNGIKSAFVNSIMNDQQCHEVISNYIKGNLNIVVISFKKIDQISLMNKPDIRFMIHYTMPMSIDDYLNHLKLIGIDGLISFSLILFSEIDVKIVNKLIVDPNDGFKKMIDYCEVESKVCRRYQICEINECNSMCDNCLMTNQKSLDMSQIGIELIKLIDRMNKPTLKMLIDVYKGKKMVEVNVDQIQKIKMIDLKKMLKKLCDRNILGIKIELTKYGEIHYFQNLASIEEIIQIFENEPLIIV